VSLQRPPMLTLFPYTTLFRSLRGDIVEVLWKKENLRNMDNDLMDINQVLLDYSKLKDGKVHALRKNHPNLLQYDKSSELKLTDRSEEHTSELQSRENLVCRLL